MRTGMRSCFLAPMLGAAAALSWVPAEARAQAADGAKWYRGMTHMHTYWSDGRAFPEQAVDVYKRLGYDFLALSDHNVFAVETNCWRPVLEKEGKWPPDVTRPLYDAYVEAFGKEVEGRIENGTNYVRLKTYAEVKARFDEPGKFLLLPAVELTQVLNGINVHLNYLNTPSALPCMTKDDRVRQIKNSALTVSELIGQNAAEVAAAARQAPYLLVLNHAFWVYCDIVPQNLVDNPDVRFFEVCNGGSAFAPNPQALNYSYDMFWDAVNAFRSLKAQALLYGIGSDDTHYYITRKESDRLADAWVMVRSASLTPGALIAAMRAGDFYTSTGVSLEEVTFSAAGKSLRVKVKEEAGVKYRIRFITTKRGFDQTVKTVDCPAEKGRGARTIPVYSEDVGKTVKTVEGAEAEYQMAADDLYVRARVDTDVPGYKRNFHPDVKVAWTQPFLAGQTVNIGMNP